MMNIRAFFKRFGTDILGYLCLLLVIPLGPLPGPGGIPLLVTGLSLLALHNSWAKKLLTYVKIHSESLRSLLFPKRVGMQRLWDVVSILLLVAAFLLWIYATNWILKISATTATTLAVIIFGSNRSRLETITSKRRR